MDKHLIRHCKEQAAGARSAAEFVDDPEAKQMMFEIAGEYERLAKRAEERFKVH